MFWLLMVYCRNHAKVCFRHTRMREWTPRKDPWVKTQTYSLLLWAPGYWTSPPSPSWKIRILLTRVLCFASRWGCYHNRSCLTIHHLSLARIACFPGHFHWQFHGGPHQYPLSVVHHLLTLLFLRCQRIFLYIHCLLGVCRWHYFESALHVFVV